MAHILIMPRQGNTVESCIIGEWKVNEGDSVEAETPVCSVETDKAAFEVPAGAKGTVLKILHPSGDDVPVLNPIMVIGEKGENWEAALPQGPIPDGTAHAQTAPNSPAAASDARLSVLHNHGLEITMNELDTLIHETHPDAPVSPRAKNLAFNEAVNPADVRTRSGPGGRIIEQDIAAYVAGRPPLTQAAKDELRKRISAGQSANVTGAGTGLGSRINAADLNNAIAPNKARAAAVQAADEFTDTPIKGIRKLIADQMMKSHNTTAAFTLNTSALAKTLQDLRARFKAAPPELGLNKITINDLVLFAVSRTLPRYLYINAHKNGETIRNWKNVHLGIAVSTERGLMVPVMRNADALSLLQISAESKKLADACRSGNINPDDLHGSTFTISNLGNTGVESFSPVINIPEVAILGVCGITPKYIETSPEHYEILPHMGLSLTIDHAVVDGAPAAEFLKALCETIKNIDIWIIRDGA